MSILDKNTFMWVYWYLYLQTNISCLNKACSYISRCYIVTFIANCRSSAVANYSYAECDDNMIQYTANLHILLILHGTVNGVVFSDPQMQSVIAKFSLRIAVKYGCNLLHSKFWFG